MCFPSGDITFIEHSALDATALCFCCFVNKPTPCTHTRARNFFYYLTVYLSTHGAFLFDVVCIWASIIMMMIITVVRGVDRWYTHWSALFFFSFVVHVCCHCTIRLLFCLVYNMHVRTNSHIYTHNNKQQSCECSFACFLFVIFVLSHPISFIFIFTFHCWWRNDGDMKNVQLK